LAKAARPAPPPRPRQLLDSAAAIRLCGGTASELLLNIDIYIIDNRYETELTPMPRSYSAALPAAYVMLRILIVLNWLMGLAILAILIWSLTHEAWTLKALGVTASADAHEVAMGMRAIAVLGLVAIPINYAILKRLVAIVGTVRQGDPFVAANAWRLNAIAWALLGLQLLSMVIGGIGEAISTKEHPFHLDAGFSPTGWLGVLLTFVLARIFAEGTLMREDLEGTV